MTAHAHALYRGTIRHRRHAVARTEFTHAITLAYLDLAALDGVPKALAPRAKDHLSGDAPTAAALAGEARALVEAHTGAPAPQGPVRLLTQPRGFNPVSFFYLFDGDAPDALRAVVADVHSTPYGERRQYVATGTGRVLQGEHDKQMHVSPFLGMDHRYRWRASAPAETLSVHIAVDDAFDATLDLARHPLTAARRATPNARTLALIYGHALGLKLRGVPVHRHPQTAAR